MSYILGAAALELGEGLNPSLVAPIIELTVDQDVYPPTATIEFDITTISTDIWDLQIATDRFFASLVVDTVGDDNLVGSGSKTGFMSGIASGKHYIRARTGRDSFGGNWSPTVVHGDTNAPVFTSSASVSVEEGQTLAHTLTTDKPGEVTLSLFGGADISHFELSASTLRFAANGIRDFEEPSDTDSNNSYIVVVRAIDLAGNVGDQSITVTVTNNPLDDPAFSEWTEVTGSNKSAYAIVSGDPALSVVGSPGVGAPMLVRAKRATNKDLFQFQITVDALGGNNKLYVGVDDGTTVLNPVSTPGFFDSHAALFVFQPNHYESVYNGVHDDADSTGVCQVGDVFTIRGNGTTGEIKRYRTRSGSTVQIGSTLTVSPPWTSFCAIAGTNDEVAQTANFGATSFAYALDSGYEAY